MLFYVAGADSAALVLAMFNQRGSLQPKTWLVVVWGCMIGAVAIALLLAGGLSAIQTTVIVFGLPFIFVMLWVCYSLVRQLRAEPVTTTVPPGVRTMLAERRGGSTMSTNGVAPHPEHPATAVVPRSDQPVP